MVLWVYDSSCNAELHGVSTFKGLLKAIEGLLKAVTGLSKTF
jgi:hypothetical protein